MTDMIYLPFIAFVLLEKHCHKKQFLSNANI